MPISERVQTLRQRSLDAVETLSHERARLMTEFIRGADPTDSVPVTRAKAFTHLLANKAIYIGGGELIVGEKGPEPKATPTYPELCCHTIDDLDILNDREKISFKVSPATRDLYTSDLIPFWEGRTMRERVFAAMTPEWIDAYEAGVFTEFMEQRSPGHTVLDDKIYKTGMLDFIDRIDDRISRLDHGAPDAEARHEQLKAMRIAAEAIILYAKRHADEAWDLAANEADPVRKAELERIADVCEHVPANAPRDFYEALQAYWFVHLGVTIEMNPWDAFCPGHLDHHLEPFYLAGLEDGSLTEEAARELLHCFWIKFNNQPAPPKVGVTAAESSTYTDFAQINTGGVRPDGSDAVNPVTYLMLDVIEEMRLLQPSSSIQVSAVNPDAFIKRAARIIRTGFGQPSVFNTDAVVRELVRQGKTIVDARCGGTSGCVETGAFGKENYNLTGYFNMPKVLEITLNDGLDPMTGKHIGISTGDPRGFETFEELFTAYERQLQHFIDIKTAGNDAIERLYAEFMPAPFLSILIDDCIENARDYHDGGARYNTTYIQGVGLGTMTDALTAIKYHVFDEGTWPMGEMLDFLAADFEGAEIERLRLVNKTPKYGNDDDYADDVMKMVFEAYFNAIDGRPNTKGGRNHINLLPTTCHVYFGSVTGATPDGRRACLPLSEGISPVQGMDQHGPTAVIKSVAKMDHLRTGGTLLNQKFTPSVLADDAGLEGLVKLIRSYFAMDGHHIQFNVVDVETLRAARANPEAYRDLIVRVAGYSDYFCDLGDALQLEIIARTEQGGL